MAIPAPKGITVRNWVQNLDSKFGRPVTKLKKKSVEMAADMGNLSDKDKVRIVLLKVQGRLKLSQIHIQNIKGKLLTLG